MKNLFSLKRGAVVALGLLAGTLQTQAQTATAPSVVYGLATVTQNFAGFTAGQQALFPLIPANLGNAAPLYGTGVPITGVTAGQQLVGIDARPSTGQLYALGYNASTGATQLYLLNPTTGLAVPTNATPITLNLQDPNSSQTGTTANTRGLITNVGFDFNPRADRIRVVAPNGMNYRLNPNTGGLAVTDTPLSYVAGSNVGHAPYIGTVAYTNSATGVTGTTLYDLDVTNTNGQPTNGLLSTQAPPNNGILNPVAPLTFQVNGNPTASPLTTPTIGLDLDVFYDRSSGSNLAYLVEARYSDPTNSNINNGTTTNRFSSNLYAFNLQTGQAVGRNIFGQVPVFISNIAAVGTDQLVWTGQLSADWQTAGNWLPSRVPTANDDVFIAGNGTLVAPGITVATQPVITAATSVARAVTLDNGAVLTTASGGVLALSGNFINNGGSVAGTGTGVISLAGAAAQDISGSAAVTTFFNLNVGPSGATTSAGVAIQRSLTVTGNLAIGAGQNLTLLSNASGTAYVANQGGAVTGTATVQRAINGALNGGLGYRHYSSPVSGNTVADFATAGYSPVINPDYNSSATPPRVTPFPTIFGYDQGRLSLTNSSPEFDRGFFSPGALTDPLTTGRGYAVNISASEVVDFRGTLNNGDVSLSNLARGPQANAGWQLLGNPYPATIDFDRVLAASSGLENALYVVKSSGQYTGGYAAYVNGNGTNGGTSNIPLGQGFFVRVAAGQTAAVTFTNAARTNAPETSPFQRLTNTSPAVALTLSGAGVANQTRVYFEQGATAGFDAAYDAHYLPATHGLDLASDLSTEALAINGLPELTGTVTVPLRVHAATAGTYTLAVDELANLPAGTHAYLRDAQTGALTDLATTPSLSLTLAPADAATGRYSIIIGANATLATAPASLAALGAVYPNPAHGTAVLVLPTSLRGQAASQVEVLNTLGQAVLRRTIAAGGADQVELPLGNLAAGIYTVRATTASGSVAKQLRVE